MSSSQHVTPSSRRSHTADRGQTGRLLQESWRDFNSQVLDAASQPAAEFSPVGAYSRQAEMVFESDHSEPPGQAIGRLSPIGIKSRYRGLSPDKENSVHDKILGIMLSDSPRSCAMRDTWNNAKHIRAAVSATISDSASKRKTLRPSSSSDCPSLDDDLENLYPSAWYTSLNNELLADILIDACMNKMLDSFIDDAVKCIEEEATGTRFDARGFSSGPPPLAIPRPWRPPPMPYELSPLADLSHSSNGTPVATTEAAEKRRRRPGNEMAFSSSLPSLNSVDSLRSDSANSSAASRSLAPVHAPACSDAVGPCSHRALQSQRPPRCLPVKGKDLRKWNLPMTAYHFPNRWEQMVRTEPSLRIPGRGGATNETGRGPQHTSQPPSPPASAKGGSSSVRGGLAALPQKSVTVDDDNPNVWKPGQVLKLDQEGKTIFPYSLVSHKAFLESQPHGWLKRRAQEVAPLRTTDRY